MYALYMLFYSIRGGCYKLEYGRGGEIRKPFLFQIFRILPSPPLRILIIRVSVPNPDLFVRSRSRSGQLPKNHTLAAPPKINALTPVPMLRHKTSQNVSSQNVSSQNVAFKDIWIRMLIRHKTSHDV